MSSLKSLAKRMLQPPMNGNVSLHKIILYFNFKACVMQDFLLRLVKVLPLQVLLPLNKVQRHLRVVLPLSLHWLKVLTKVRRQLHLLLTLRLKSLI